MWDSILQYAVETVIQLLLPIVLGALATLAIKGVKKLQASIDADKYTFAVALAYQLVLAAEQSGLAGYIENTSEQKLDWVMTKMEEGLAKRGINLDLDEIRAIVEAQVMEAFNQFKEEIQP